MKDPSIAIIINELQKGAHPDKPLPNTYFMNTDSVLYCYVREGFEAIVVPKKLYQIVLIMYHDLMGHNGTTQLYRYIGRFYFWQKLKQECTKHVHQCKEYQQVSLKESYYVDFDLQIPKLAMSFIAMDLLGEYSQAENGNCYTLTVICMLTPFVKIIPFKDKKTEMAINAYIKYIYADKG